jgi:phage baseplate assembly protein W
MSAIALFSQLKKISQVESETIQQRARRLKVAAIRCKRWEKRIRMKKVLEPDATSGFTIEV